MQEEHKKKDIKYWISIHHVASVSLKEEPSDAVWIIKQPAAPRTGNSWTVAAVVRLRNRPVSEEEK